MSLVVTCNENKCVVSGRVTNIHKSGVKTTLTVENNICARRYERGSVRIDFDKNFVDKMNVRKGSFIVAVTSIEFPLEIIADGGIVKVNEFHVDKGFFFMYSGEIILESSGFSPEEHVFFGTIENAREYISRKNGKLVSEYELYYRSGKTHKRERIKAFGRHVPENAVGKKVIVRSGKPIDRGKGKYWWATDIIWC